METVRRCSRRFVFSARAIARVFRKRRHAIKGNITVYTFEVDEGKREKIFLTFSPGSVLPHRSELVAQKSVCEVNHSNNVEQSQDLAQEEVDGVT